MTVLFLALALGCVAASIWLVATDVIASRSQRAALARVGGYGSRVHVAARPEARRGPDVVRPLAAIALRLAPGRDRMRTAAQLQAAGFSADRLDAFLASKVGLALAGAMLGVLAGAGLGGATTAAVLAVTFAAAGFVLPDVVLARRAVARREEILRELPNALDLIAVIVEAGLGLDAALARYADRANGPLAQELAFMVAEMRVGSTRAAVLRGFAERVPALETLAFVRAITAADQLGVSLSHTLRTQARDARIRRQTLAEQRANKVPIKMLFPTVLCIFPALFVAVLAPALITLLQS